MRVPTFALAAIVVLVLSACGSTSTSSNSNSTADLPTGVVAQVGSMSITTAAYQHALAIVIAQDSVQRKVESSPTAFELANLAKTLKESLLIMPVAPKYTACIARWQAYGPKPAPGKSKPPVSELKMLCEREYKLLQQEALEPLIVIDWNLAEAAAQRISVSAAEVSRQLQAQLSRQFHSRAAFHKFLASSRETTADLLLATKVRLLRGMLNEQAIPNHAKLAKELVALKLKALTEDFEYKWKAKTTCNAGYVITDCKEYKRPSVVTHQRATTPEAGASVPGAGPVTAPAPPAAPPPSASSPPSAARPPAESSPAIEAKK